MKYLLIIFGLIAVIGIYANKSEVQSTIATALGCQEGTILNSPVSDIKDTILYHKRGPFVENDTLFLLRSADNTSGFHDFEDVFIETDRQSKRFQNVLTRGSNMILKEEERNEFNEVLKRSKKNHLEPLIKHPISDISKGWIPLHSFQGKYYINSIDIFYIFWITDSLYVRNYMDGPTPYIIRSAKKVSPKHYQLYLGYENIKSIDLYVVDDKRKIAVAVESMPKTSYKRTSLFVSSETAHLFDLIDWNSSTMPVDHLEYDKIDFQKLILHNE